MRMSLAKRALWVPLFIGLTTTSALPQSQISGGTCSPNVINSTNVSVICTIYRVEPTQGGVPSAPKAAPKEVQPDTLNDSKVKSRNTTENPAAAVKPGPSSPADTAKPIPRPRQPRLRLGQFSTFDRQCYPRQIPEVRIIEAPKFGRLEAEVGPAAVLRSAFGSAEHCVGKIVTSNIVSYALNKDAPTRIDTDHAKILVTFPSDRAAISRNYIYTINIKPLSRQCVGGDC